jgi:D-threonate/D-erythronate kinase
MRQKSIINFFNFYQLNPKILIVADDLTGAAELGGIAFHCGLTVRILLDSETGFHFPENVVILDSNTRNMAPEKAYQEIKKLLSGIDLSSFDLIFKKVDSLLRGPICSEIKAMLDVINIDQAYLVPANPSRNRIIRSGKYYIDNIPINNTDFRSDPHYPRTSKYVRDLITDSCHTLITADDPTHKSRIRIMIPDIISCEELGTFVADMPNEPMLLAGAADFFAEILFAKFKRKPSDKTRRFDIAGSVHFLVGSNSQSSKHTVRKLAGKDYIVSRLPIAALENNERFDEWTNHLVRELKKQRCIAIAGPFRRVDEALRINLINEKLVKSAGIMFKYMSSGSFLLIEGGETSSRFFRFMKWHDLTISDAFETGIVSLSPPDCDIRIIIKPGSYKWPESILNPIQEIFHDIGK